MHRRALLTRLAGLASTLAAGPGFAQTATQTATLSPEDSALADKASAYLQGLTLAEGRFTQTDPAGRATEGRFWLDRPGRIRFEYDPPSGLLVVADGHRVNVWNPRLKSFNAYPLGFTPLHVFLDRQVRLDRGARIERVERTAEGFTLTLRDRRRPHDGAIILGFAEGPLRLTDWTLQDARGQRTRVVLGALKRPASLDAGLFVLANPLRARAGPDSGV